MEATLRSAHEESAIQSVHADFSEIDPIPNRSAFEVVDLILHAQIDHPYRIEGANIGIGHSREARIKNRGG